MAEAEDRLDFCKQALGEIGTRSTITSLDPSDGSQEAYYCNLFFESTRDQVLRAAHWNFAGISDTLTLWKAQPGTPEPDDPVRSLPGAIEIRHPVGSIPMCIRGRILQIRRVRGQPQGQPQTGLPQTGSPALVPFYGGVVGAGYQRECVRSRSVSISTTAPAIASGSPAQSAR
jgi:hypothetical protein